MFYKNQLWKCMYKITVCTLFLINLISFSSSKHVSLAHFCECIKNIKIFFSFLKTNLKRLPNVGPIMYPNLSRYQSRRDKLTLGHIVLTTLISQNIPTLAQCC